MPAMEQDLERGQDDPRRPRDPRHPWCPPSPSLLFWLLILFLAFMLWLFILLSSNPLTALALAYSLCVLFIIIIIIIILCGLSPRMMRLLVCFCLLCLLGKCPLPHHLQPLFLPYLLSQHSPPTLCFLLSGHT